MAVSDRNLPWLLGGAFCMPGVVCLAIAAWLFTEDYAVRRWPRTPGTMTVARNETRSVRDQESAGYATVTLYSPFVRYAYAVGGRRYEGTRLRRTPESSNVPFDLDRYAPGSSVPVAYDPADPSQSVLEEEPLGTGTLIMGCLGAFFLLFGAVLTFAMRRGLRDAPAG